MNAPFVDAIIQHHVEAPRHGDYQLGQAFVGMAAPLRAARHIGEVLYARDIEGDMVTAFDEGQVSARDGYLREIQHATVGSAHFREILSSAGLPITVAPGGTSRTTTAPAATMAPAPTVRPGQITAPAPMDAPIPITV